MDYAFWEKLFGGGILIGAELIFPLGIKLRPSFFRWETAQAFKKIRREMILALIGSVISGVCLWLLYEIDAIILIWDTKFL